jgi:hypothetical protein
VSEQRVTVWAVDLLAAPDRDTRGSLSLGPGAIEFTPDDGPTASIAFSDVLKVRRLRGSPVLMVVHERDGVLRRTAFFFVQPPPLDPRRDRPERPTLLSGSSKRRVRRRNAGYLGMGNRARREVVAAWEARMRAALTDARG